LIKYRTRSHQKYVVELDQDKFIGKSRHGLTDESILV